MESRTSRDIHCLQGEKVHGGQQDILQAYLSVHGCSTSVQRRHGCCRRIEPGRVFGRMGFHFTVAMLCSPHSADTYRGNIERRHCPLVANGIVGHSAPTVRTTFPSRRRHQHESRRPLNCGGVLEPSPLVPVDQSQAVNENRNPSFLQWRASVSASHSSMAMADTLVSLRRRPTKHSHALDFEVSVAWPRAVCLL